MSYLIDKKELKRKLDEIQSTYDLMPDDARVCDVCFGIFPKKKRGSYDVCWCDYESRDIDPD